MSTDNKTLADAQPGGRVRLGDGVRYSKCEGRGYFDVDVDVDDSGGSIGNIEACPHCTLSAQPSPGGQWAPEIEQLHKLVSSILSTVSLGYQTGPYAYAGEDFGGYLHEAASNCRTILRGLSNIAARQPVRIYGCCAQPEGELHTAECPNMRHLAARQPVGEIVGWQHCGENHEHMVISDSTKQALKEGETGNGIRKIDAAYSIPLYAAPTPQAVDSWSVIDRVAKNWDGCSIGAAIRAEATKVIGQPAQVVDLDELRRAVCVVNVVGQIDGHDVVRRNSVLDVVDTRRQRMADSQDVQS